LVKYDADKQVFEVVFERDGFKANGKAKIPPEIAKSLRENKEQFSFRYENADLRSINYTLIPIKMSIYGKNGERYEVDFDIPKTAKEIVFKGAELWKDNPYAKSLNVSLAEAIKRYAPIKEAAIQAAEVARQAAEAEAARKAAEAEAARIAAEKAAEEAAKKAAEEQRKRNDMVKKGLTDPRDNKKYKLVEIGSQIWMAENLNYEVKDSKCYDNKSDNCKKYGRLYNWGTAKSACPSGWHLPSDAEFNATFNRNLRDAMAGKKDIGGENLKVFNAQFGGSGNSNGSFKYIEGICYGNMGCQIGRGFWWSSTDKNATEALGKTINSDRTDMNETLGDKTKDLYSVRCVMD